MKLSTSVVRLSLTSFGLALALAGCGGPDNEKSATTNTDGTATKDVTSGPVKSADEIYKDMSKNSSNDLMQTKGYRKK